jgi:hypothetical protein
VDSPHKEKFLIALKSDIEQESGQEEVHRRHAGSAEIMGCGWKAMVWVSIPRQLSQSLSIIRCRMAGNFGLCEGDHRRAFYAKGVSASGGDFGKFFPQQ